jgi:hypothetical protein
MIGRIVVGWPRIWKMGIITAVLCLTKNFARTGRYPGLTNRYRLISGENVTVFGGHWSFMVWTKVYRQGVGIEQCILV